jgi:methionine-rich copper-binding protein CopC
MGMIAVGALLVAAVTVAMSGTAYAHASYVSSDPAADAVLAAAPTKVTIKFAEHVNPNGSDVVVYDAKHTVVSTGPAQVVQSDLFNMTVNMKGNDSDIYLVEWHTVSADDGDPDIGAFVFHVSSAPGAQATATASAKSGGTGSGSGSGKSSSTSGAPAWLVILVGLVGLGVGAGGAMALRRRDDGATPLDAGE